VKPARPATHAVLAIAQVEGKQRVMVRSTPPPALKSAPVALHVANVAKAQAHHPKGCAPFTVGPGVYARLDCRKYAKITGAKIAHPLAKIQLFKNGQLRIDPPSPKTFGVALAASGTGVQAASPDLPGSVDHRTAGTEGPVKDQGVVGSCSASSLSTMMDNAIRRLNNNDAISSLHLWSHYGVPEMSMAASSNLNKPIAVWADLPYDAKVACQMESASFDDCSDLFDPPVQAGSAASNPTIQAQIHNADKRGRYKITEVDELTPIDPEVLAGDLAIGKDIWLGISVGVDAWTGPAVQKTGVISDYTEEDGGHAVVLAGYRDAGGTRQFLIHNSWGASWGQGGYAWISENMIRQHAELAYTITVVDLQAPPPPPTPKPSASGACASGYTETPGIPVCQRICTADANCGPGGVCVNVSETSSQQVCVAVNPLTDDDCGDNDMVDAVTGLCAPTCGNGGRPAAGQC
jgi:hypothetical protein